MKDLSKASASRRSIEEDSENQRIDNYLSKVLKGVPKSHIYRILRSGEVRVNGKRIEPNYRLKIGDTLRLPPVRTAKPVKQAGNAFPNLRLEVLFEDDVLLVINKPAGVAVHGGSGVSSGIVELLRMRKPKAPFLELVHRLDRETSGVLLLAKKRSALITLHQRLREGQVEKRYLAMVKGRWINQKQSVELPLHKYVTAAGERRVTVNPRGQAAHTLFYLRKSWQEFSLLEAELKTGRTHQIRAHLAHLGFPILGDPKYGDFALNRFLATRGLKRMFLHAFRLVVQHPRTGQALRLDAPLPTDLEQFVDELGRPM
ncbi:MAG TPA: RluA family pseudouridine synthase [Burkholderiales bacterium]|nr:RluA family pseudouridine synthase [Burkholderiales bacterium]